MRLDLLVINLQDERTMNLFRISFVCFLSLTLAGCMSQTDVPEEDVAETKSEEATPEGKVLRHAVFFAFQEKTSPKEIQSVIDAFSALPAKIPQIKAFEWGVNNSPETHDDGFTHCFLLTFADTAGRDAYLPHPAHKAFGDVLRPHMKDVFVIDYWGDKNAPKQKKALRHAVFFRFKPNASKSDIAAVESAFAELPSKIPEIKAFEWGKNNSPESHDDGFTHAFLLSFENDEGRATYLPHPDHKAFVEILKPVLDAPRVLDWISMQ